MNKLISAFVIGVVFGIGLTIAQMINPAKVLSFLDLAGTWDPSLALVMGSAAGVAAIGYRLAWRRQPLFEQAFLIPTRNDLDLRLIIGGALFGVGWGIAGLCPGPALVTLALGYNEGVIFSLSMIAGIGLFELFDRARPSPAAGTA